MKRANGGVRRWLAMGAVALGLAACGGGGGGESDEAVALADARGGFLLAAAADGRQYSLAIDFHEKTFRLDGTSVADRGATVSGTFTQQGDEFLFRPDNAGASAGSNPARFRFTGGDEAIVGALPLPEGAVPFVAPRRHVATLEEAAGTYNLFERSVDRATGIPVATGIRQVQVTADGRYLTCNDAAVFRMADCPPASVATATIRVFSGTEQFTVFDTPTHIFAFSIGRVGNERILLRTDAGTLGVDANRPFVVGLPAVDAFTPANFVGGTADPAWGTVTLGEASFASSATLASGATVTRSGTAGPGPEVDVRSIQSSEAGNLFAGHGTEVGVVVAAPDNTLAPGFIAIGKVQ